MSRYCKQIKYSFQETPIYSTPVYSLESLVGHEFFFFLYQSFSLSHSLHCHLSSCIYAMNKWKVRLVIAHKWFRGLSPVVEFPQSLPLNYPFFFPQLSFFIFIYLFFSIFPLSINEFTTTLFAGINLHGFMYKRVF